MCFTKNKNTYYWSGIFFLLQYQQKIRELKEALEEKTKESKRMKSSLEAVKGMNEVLKKQVRVSFVFLLLPGALLHVLF